MAQVIENTSTPPKGRGPLGKSEMTLAYTMILPTILIVLSIVLLPLLANFWISFKPVQLGDLRAPTVISNERLRPAPQAAGDEAEISYRLRNSSQKGVISDIVLVDNLPTGITIAGDIDGRCALSGSELRCDLGEYEPGQRETLVLPVIAEQAYIDNPENPRSSKPQITGSADNILTNDAVSYTHLTLPTILLV